MLEVTKLTAKEFREMINAGGERLSENVDLINSLNVFPVPDGDTGTNMNMSFMSGVERLNEHDSQHVGQLSSALAKGLLMGARGNSGVILSQIFRGFNQAIKSYETLTAMEFAQMFGGGVESAYQAVMKPVEGTILTVARESAVAGEYAANETDDIIQVMEAIVEGAKKSLDHTPELLPVLKQVGVVDSGGKGLLCLYEGMLASLKGVVKDSSGQAQAQSKPLVSAALESEHPMSLDDITFGFCTEIMVRLDKQKKAFDYNDFRNTLDQEGDSLLVVADDEVVKVHIHTENPGKIMQYGQEFGELIKIKVDNMREQVRELEKTSQATKQVPVQKEKYAVIAVASGQGLVELFQSMGVTTVIEGGQTMNPSTEDFVKAIESIQAENIILLPNNKNIVMAAEQAIQVTEVPSIVIPTTTIPEGLASIMGLNPEHSLDENRQSMKAMSQEVSSGQITYSIRDTEIDGIKIKKDEYMGIVNGRIILSEAEIQTALSQTIQGMLTDDSEFMTLIIGEDGDEEIAHLVAEELAEQDDKLEIEIVQGDQPVYHYLISVE